MDQFYRAVVNVVRSSIEQVFVPNIGFETNVKSETVWIKKNKKKRKKKKKIHFYSYCK